MASTSLDLDDAVLDLTALFGPLPTGLLLNVVFNDSTWETVRPRILRRFPQATVLEEPDNKEMIDGLRGRPTAWTRPPQVIIQGTGRLDVPTLVPKLSSWLRNRDCMFLIFTSGEEGGKALKFYSHIRWVFQVRGKGYALKCVKDATSPHQGRTVYLDHDLDHLAPAKGPTCWTRLLRLSEEG